jgi:hypothetical protein
MRRVGTRRWIHTIGQYNDAGGIAFRRSIVNASGRNFRMTITRRVLMPVAASGLLVSRASTALGFSTGESAPSPDAAIESGAILAEKFGAGGKDLIFIPGLAGGAWSWTGMARRFSSSHTVYTLTLPGFDGRASIAAPIIDKVVADIARFIEDRRLGKPILVGTASAHSLRCESASSTRNRLAAPSPSTAIQYSRLSPIRTPKGDAAARCVLPSNSRSDPTLKNSEL